MKKKLLTTAVLASIAGTAGAVNVNPDGLGQVGLYPYYTVQGGNDTYVSVVNTSSVVKAVKVRFLEGKNSREVLDFNLYLSPFDIWTGAVTATVSGAKLVSFDKSCTVPAIPAGGVDFRTFEFTLTREDGEQGRIATGEDPALVAVRNLQRTREGYLEVIEMGVVNDIADPSTFKPATWATHTTANCAGLITAWGAGGTWTTSFGATGLSAPTGQLFGTGVIVNVAKGTASSYNATELDAFRNVQIHTAPGSLIPNLDSALPTSSIVFNNGAVASDNWGNGADAVSATIMSSTLANEYSIETGLLASTDWVVTFPTKWFYTQRPGPATAPFTKTFGGENPPNLTPIAGGACEPVSLTTWNREEGTVSNLDFSPLPPGGNALCWEANVITFKNTNALGSVNLKLNVDPGFENGWMSLGFVSAGHAMTALGVAGNTYNGLPAIGFGTTNIVNNAVSAGVLANYGYLFNHRATRSIVPPGP